MGKRVSRVGESPRKRRLLDGVLLLGGQQLLPRGMDEDVCQGEAGIQLLESERARTQKPVETARDPLTLFLREGLGRRAHRGTRVGRGSGGLVRAKSARLHGLDGVAGVVDESEARRSAMSVGLSSNEELQGPEADAVAGAQLEVARTGHHAPVVAEDEDRAQPPTWRAN
jgi:hypothetical protein